MATSPTHILPRVTAFPILPEGHLLYKVSDALSLPPKERHGSPLIGQYAPEIVLKDQLDRDCSLHATIALGRPIILYFFPLAGSPHCTIQGCSFRDALMDSATFVEQDAIVIGVSQDSPDMLKRFVNKHDLNFIVLSDEKREAFDIFGINTKLFGLLNSRATFIIDPSGIVRGMCEGVLAARGHMAFAEKWLRRIEDEMWHRPKNAISAVMVSSLSDGAAPAPQWAQGWNVDRAQEKRANGNSDAAAGSSARGVSGKRSLRKGLFKRSGTPAPLPPTYQNFDSGVQDYGEVEDPLASGAGMTRPGSWEGPSTRRVTAQSPTSMARNASSGSTSPSRLNGERIGSHSRTGSSGSQNLDGVARKHAGSEEDDETFVPIPMPKSQSTVKKATKSSKDRLSGVVKGGVLPPITSSLSRTGSQTQSRAVVPPPTLTEVDEDRETEAVVRRIANGAVDITPRAVPLQSAAPTSPSNLSFSMAGPIPQAPKRTTSRIQHQAPILAQLSPGRIPAKSSTDTVLESTRGLPPPKYSSLNPSTTFDATRGPNGVYSHNLAPRPPATRIAPVRSQPQETTKRHVVTPGGQDDEDSSEGELTEGEGLDDDDPLSEAVQVQAAHRMTLHSQPVSPIKNVDLAAMRHSRSRSLSKLGLSGDHSMTTPASPSSFAGSHGSGGGRSNPSYSTGASVRSQGPAPALSPGMLNAEGRELSSDAGSSSLASTSASDLQRLDMERRGSERTDASSHFGAEEARREGQRRASGASMASSSSQNSAGTFGEAS